MPSIPPEKMVLNVMEVSLVGLEDVLSVSYTGTLTKFHHQMIVLAPRLPFHIRKHAV